MVGHHVGARSQHRGGSTLCHSFAAPLAASNNERVVPLPPLTPAEDESGDEDGDGMGWDEEEVRTLRGRG